MCLAGYSADMTNETTTEQAKTPEEERHAVLSRGRIASVGRTKMRVWSLREYLPNEGEWFVPVKVPVAEHQHGWIKREVPPVEILQAILELKELTNSILKTVKQEAVIVQQFCDLLAFAMSEEA